MTRSSSARRVALSMVQAEGDDDGMDAELKHRAALRGSSAGRQGGPCDTTQARLSSLGSGVGPGTLPLNFWGCLGTDGWSHHDASERALI